MSLRNYYHAVELIRHDEPFEALIMAAIFKADTQNKILLKNLYPEIYAEVKERYDLPGGRLKGDKL